MKSAGPQSLRRSRLLRKLQSSCAGSVENALNSTYEKTAKTSMATVSVGLGLSNFRNFAAKTIMDITDMQPQNHLPISTWRSLLERHMLLKIVAGGIRAGKSASEVASSNILPTRVVVAMMT
jgi:hypothetical protein